MAGISLNKLKTVQEIQTSRNLDAGIEHKVIQKIKHNTENAKIFEEMMTQIKVSRPLGQSLQSKTKAAKVVEVLWNCNFSQG